MDVGLGGAATDPSEAGASAMGGSGGCLGSYRACGCGCCSNQTARRKCVYPSLGQDLTRIIAADVKLSRDTAACANVACSMGETYFCCEDAPQDGDAATYHTSLSFGGFDRIRLHKLSTECSTFTLLSPAGPAAAQEPGVFPVEVPTGWALESVTTLRCTSSAIGPGAIGAIGQFSLRVLGDACVVDAHLTAFFSDDAQEVRRVRFDADAVPLDLPVARCK